MERTFQVEIKVREITGAHQLVIYEVGQSGGLHLPREICRIPDDESFEDTHFSELLEQGVMAMGSAKDMLTPQAEFKLITGEAELEEYLSELYRSNTGVRRAAQIFGELAVDMVRRKIVERDVAPPGQYL